MKVILGIDPALNNVGYCVLFYDEVKDEIKDVRYGIYKIDPKKTTEQKLSIIFSTTKNILKEYGVTEAVLEKAYHNPRMARGGFVVREVIGVIKVAIVQEDKPIYYYTPQKIKKEIAGSGKADKLEVAKAVFKQLGFSQISIQQHVRNQTVILNLCPEDLIRKKLDHVSDAMSIAYCRVQEIRFLERGRCADVSV